MPTPPASVNVGLLPILSADEVARDPILDAVAAPRRRLPSWLKRPIPESRGTYFTQDLVGELGLETICESGKCPNRSECWTRRTATFMVLGGLALMLSYEPWQVPIRTQLEGNSLVLPMLVFIPALIGLILQETQRGGEPATG